MCVQTGLVFATCAAFLNSTNCLCMLEGGRMRDHTGAVAAADVVATNTGK